MRLQLTGMTLAAVLASGVASQAAEDAATTAAPAVQIAPAKTDDKVRITLQTVPPRKAIVKWGRKKLGIIPAPKPLVVVRPRDSGPLDLVIRMTGYLPVHTRAYTFSDSRVAVRLTPVEEKNTLFGYREELPPEEEVAPATPEQDPTAPTPTAPTQAPVANPVTPATPQQSTTAQ